MTTLNPQDKKALIEDHINKLKEIIDVRNGLEEHLEEARKEITMSGDEHKIAQLKNRVVELEIEIQKITDEGSRHIRSIDKINGTR